MTLQSNSNILNNNKSLSVQISLSGLSFLITNSVSNEVIFFKEKLEGIASTPEELLGNLQNCFSEITELQSYFKEINVIYVTNLFNQVPTSLFDPTKASDYLKFNSKILVNDFIAYDTLEELDITTVYIPYININNFIFDRFGDFNYFHATTILLKHIYNNEKHYSLPKLYLHVLNDSYYLTIIKNGTLLISNSYDYKTPEDFIYYILFVLEQLKLNPETIDTIISGYIEEKDSTYKILYNYIRNISFNNYKKEIKLGINNSSHKNLLLKLSLQ